MCRCQQRECDSRSSVGFFGLLFRVVMVYLALIFVGGTLIATGHPVAVEVGEIMHLVTFVDHVSPWFGNHGMEGVETFLTFASNGITFS